MVDDFANYEHKPGAKTTLVSDPNTGQPVEVELNDDGTPKMPEVKPTYRPSQDEIDAAAKKNAPPQPTSGIPGVPSPNQAKGEPAPYADTPPQATAPNPTPWPETEPGNANPPIRQLPPTATTNAGPVPPKEA